MAARRFWRQKSSRRVESSGTTSSGGTAASHSVTAILKLRYAGFEVVKRFEAFGAVVEPEFDPRQTVLAGGLRRDMPLEIGVGLNQVPEIVDQFAFIANIGACLLESVIFTGQ